MVGAASVPNYLSVMQVSERGSNTTCIVSDLFDADATYLSDLIFDRPLLHGLQVETQVSRILLCFVKLQDQWICHVFVLGQLVELHFFTQASCPISVLARLFHDNDEFRDRMAISDDLIAC